MAPVFNEPNTWRSIATELSVLFDLVVIVDDGSEQMLEHPNQDGVVLLRHDKNMGKGAALKSGFRYCLDHSAQVIATIDTDGEHDTRNFIRALGLYAGEDLITLSRAPFYRRYTWLRRVRNQLFSFFMSRRIGLKVADTQSGMRLFSAAAVRHCLGQTWPTGYAVETIMMESIVRNKMRVVEHPMQHPGLIRNGKKYSEFSVMWSDFLTFSSRLLRNDNAFEAQTSNIETLLPEDAMRRIERKV